jgi:hypothetical protein
VRHEDIPEINNPKIRFPVLEGDKLMKLKISEPQMLNLIREGQPVPRFLRVENISNA